LGNVRATVTLGLSTPKYAADYYPFGLKRAHDGESYRYGYQGDFAEEDEETGFNHFELRDYDPVIGRWMVVDPKRQYYSGYKAMGNNPITSIDPDGGSSYSTHTDKNGKVLAVYNDKDLGVYKHDISIGDYDGSFLSKENGTLMGHTYIWHEFSNHNNITGAIGDALYGYQINFNQSIDGVLNGLNQQLIQRIESEGLVSAGLWAKRESGGKGDLDIKHTLGDQGYLMGGRYVTMRSAGNFLAGYNAATLKPSVYTWNAWYYTSIQFAGKVHMEGNKLHSEPHGGRWMGEIEYSGRMFDAGFNAVKWKN
jgi:RHS repeat-associated protein